MNLDTQIKIFLYNKDNNNRTDHMKAEAYKAVSFFTDIAGSCSFEENFLSYQKGGIKLNSIKISCIYDGADANLVKTFMDRFKSDIKLHDKIILIEEYEDI